MPRERRTSTASIKVLKKWKKWRRKDASFFNAARTQTLDHCAYYGCKYTHAQSNISHAKSHDQRTADES